MSELGLGVEEERDDRRKKRRKQQQQRSLHLRTAGLDQRGRFDSPDEKDSSFRSKEGKVLVQGKEVEDEDETLNREIHSFPHSLPATEADLAQLEERILEEEETLGPPFHSSCHSPTEKFRNQTVNSETHPSIINRRFPRTASLDLNCHNAVILSPQFLAGGTANLNKSPWTPNYQKGWNSERVPLASNVRQRYLGNGKALPSKWDDAERWIGSPISVDYTGRFVHPSYYRRPKSKSGPLGPHSPLVPRIDSGGVVNMAASSPFLAGVLVADRQCYGSARGSAGGCGGGSFVSANVESYIVQQSAAVHGWSDLSSQDTTQEDKLDSKGGSIITSPKVSQKDMATQMSPSGSTHSSPDKRWPLSSVPPSADPIEELEPHFSKLEIRDVQVDDQFTVSQRPKKHVASERCLRNIIEWKNKTEDDKDSAAWEVDEPSKFLSKYNREEAKIGAWRSLQEAKAEAAIRKLEMKLEKERSSSMDKILNKLRSAQRKAEGMRMTTRTSQAHRTERTSRKASFFIKKYSQMSFLGSCFTCRAP